MSKDDKETIDYNVIPKPSLRRLASYLDVLEQFHASGTSWVTCQMLSMQTDTEPSLVRKDIAYTGLAGKQRMGYPLCDLISAIEKLIGWDNRTDAFLVGVGNLGSAILGYKGFEKYGLNILCGFDVDKVKIGTSIHGKIILDIRHLGDLARRMHVNIGIIACGIEAAQTVADQLVKAKICAIWNFTQAKLKLPPGVIVENVDLAASLALLSTRLSKLKDLELTSHAISNNPTITKQI